MKSLWQHSLRDSVVEKSHIAEIYLQKFGLSTELQIRKAADLKATEELRASSNRTEHSALREGLSRSCAFCTHCKNFDRIITKNEEADSIIHLRWTLFINLKQYLLTKSDFGPQILPTKLLKCP